MREKPPQMNLAEINAFMREQRHARRANRARAEAESENVDMDDLIAQAEREQKRDGQPPQEEKRPLQKERAAASEPVQKPQSARPPPGIVRRAESAHDKAPEARRKSKPEEKLVVLDREHMNELFRQQRDELRLNRERIRKVKNGAHDPDLVPVSGSKTKRKAKEALPELKSDLSQALNKKSAGDFLRSRSAVLIQLQAAEQKEGTVPKQNLDRILERAKALNEALDISDAKEGPDEPETEPTCGQFFLPDKVLNFPVVRDSDSLAYRAEAIRAFLEREMGLDKLLALKQAAAGDADGRAEVILRDCEPGVVVLAQQLFVLEETTASA
jgi:hypothetical protein